MHKQIYSMVDSNYQRKKLIIMEKSDISGNIKMNRMKPIKPVEDTETSELMDELIQILKDPTEYKNKIRLATKEQRDIKLGEIEQIRNKEINVYIPDVIIGFLLMDKRGLNGKKQTELLMRVTKNDNN